MSSVGELTQDDLRFVMEEVVDVTAKWRDLGLVLGVKEPQLDTIELETNNRPQAALRKMLVDWLKNAPCPTWKQLVDALRSRLVQEPRLAADIEKRRCPLASAPAEAQSKGASVTERTPIPAGVTAAKLAEELSPITPKWYLFCSQLGVEKWRLDDLEAGSLGVSRSSVCLQHALDIWMTGKHDVTYNKIIEALESQQVANKKLSGKFRDKLQH